MARIVYVYLVGLFIVLSIRDVAAQTDSIVSQTWRRDPNSDIENTVSNQKQIITKEQILYSGYVLVSDVLQLVDGWTVSTWNGDRWNQQNGAGNYQNQNWTLMLNGQRIELMKLDAQHINTLGISVNDIERIEVINVAGNYLGEFNDKGIIHIITKKNTEGLTYRLFASNGNEIGDPHMDVFNNSGLNVHQFGTNYGNYLAFRKKKWNIQLNQYGNDYSYRDSSDLLYPLVKHYNPSTGYGNTLLCGNIQVTYTSAKITHHLTGIISRTGDAIMPAGIFNPVTGQHDYNTVGYTMRYVLQKGILQYRGSLMQRTFTGADQKQLSHEQYYLTNNLNYTTRQPTRKGDKTTQIGLAYDYITTQMLDTLTANNTIAHIVRPYYSLTYPLTKKSNIFTDISVATDFEHIIPKFVLGYYKQPTIITNWSFVASFAQRSQAENNSYFSMLPMIDTTLTYLSGEIAGTGTLDYYYNININKYFKVSFNSGLKFINHDLFFRPTTVLNTTNPVLLNTEIDQMNQTRWVNRLNVHYDMLKNTLFDINYLNTSVLNDEWSGQNSIPKHRFSFVLVQSLPARLNVWARYYYQSSTYWINPALMIQPGNTTSQELYMQLSSIHTIDMGITKKLLKDYMIINLSLRNILNTQEQYQANGAAFYMRLFLSMKINIDGLFAKNN